MSSFWNAIMISPERQNPLLASIIQHVVDNIRRLSYGAEKGIGNIGKERHGDDLNFDALGITGPVALARAIGLSKAHCQGGPLGRWDWMNWTKATPGQIDVPAEHIWPVENAYHPEFISNGTTNMEEAVFNLLDTDTNQTLSSES